MAKIPFYDDRLTPQGGLNVQARFAEQTTAMDTALQNLGNQGTSAGAILMKIENDNAVANAAKPIAEMHPWGVQTLQGLSDKSRDGGYVDMPDGTTKTVTEAFGQQWEEQSKKMLEGITNPVARQYAEKHLVTTYASLKTAAIQTEHGLLQKNRTDSFDKSVATMAGDVAGDDKLVDQRLKDMEELGRKLGMDEHTLNTKLKAGRRSIVESAAAGAIQRNAPEVAEAIKQRYGVTGVDVPMKSYANLTPENQTLISDTATRLGISPGNLAAIISYETGGTFSPSMRGGKNNKHIGLIQFGEEEQKAYGANQQQSFSEQMVAVEKYLKARGVQPGDDLGTLYKIVNGGNRNVSGSASDGNGTIDEHVERIAKEHGGSTKRSSSVPVSPAVQRIVASLEPERLDTFLNVANSTINKQEVVYRTQVAAAEQDHITAWQNGDQVAQPMTQQDYVKAYGPVEGVQRYAQYQQIGAMGSDIAALKTAPVTDQAAIVEKYKPEAGSPGYALAEKRYEAIKGAAAKINQDRSQDPVAWAQRSGMAPGGSIQWNDITNKPENIAMALNSRMGLATTMREKYGAPYQLLSKDEASKLVTGFNGMDAQQKIAFLGLISKSVNNTEAAQAIFQQVAPDSPVSAFAAHLFVSSGDYVQKGGWFTSDQKFNPQTVATTILRGEGLINPTKADKASNGKPSNLLLPEDSKMRPDFNNAVKDLFPGSPEQADLVYQTAKAYYAAKTSDAGDFSAEYAGEAPRRWKEAINVVVGGISDINGKNVRRPWGMDETKFKDALFENFRATTNAAGLPGRAPDFRAFNFIAMPDNTYIAYNGLGRLVGTNGRPLEFSLDNRTAATNSQPVVPPTVDQTPTTNSKTLKTK